MQNVYDTLLERGLIQQTTHEQEIKSLLANERVSFYIGYDPTSDSLTAGGFLTIMTMMHMQRAGHRPVILMGGATGMVGDPTDKTEMRKMMSKDEIEHNVNGIQKQLSRFIEFGDGKAIMVNNVDWLLELKYVPFIREYGVHFSVNKMLTADAYKTRFERGLTFFEFNYMLMQSYDFLELYRRHNVKLQIGGNDQWSNIISGVDLIRRAENANAYGLTMPLLARSDGEKMGKSMYGAVWLDAGKTSPYDFFQYWRNVDDRDVSNFMAFLTFLPMEQVNETKKLSGSELNKAKELLAYEITQTVHGKEEADKALAAARALFGGGQMEGSVPVTEIPAAQFGQGMGIIDVLETAGLIPSRGEGRRLVLQGGIRVGDQKVESIDHIVRASDLTDNAIMVQKGKKIFHQIKVV